MDIDSETQRKPISIIQEIESQLENYLHRQHEEIEQKLEERIQEERKIARQQLAQIEEEIRKEWQALDDYGRVMEQFEEEKNQIVQRIREYLDNIVQRQQRIEELARETSEDIKSINELQNRLEEIRSQSMEKSTFLRGELEEKFGLKAKLLEETSEEETVKIDLSSELEKLQKVKELLAMEAEIKNEHIPSATQLEGGPPEAESQEQTEAEAQAFIQPEPVFLKEPSLEEKLAEGIKKGLAEKLASVRTLEEESVDSRDVQKDNADRQDLISCYRQESANGSGRIGYYQKDDHYVFEVREIFNRIKKTVDEAKKIYYKLNLVSSVKEQFFFKRELIAEQEGLKKYLQKIIYLLEKKGFTFPLVSQDILNQIVAVELVDLLQSQNWGAPEDLNHFEQRIMAIISSFNEKANPPSVYYLALRKELGF
ncbi:MAG: hypothetical protein PHU81_01890 [Acidobacteriota bacterium]|nr:hypothetical protein [Acidobacteriota bacterium]